MKNPTPRKKVENFLQSIQEHEPVVFCVRCGSTHLDQNFINELRCYECGNTSKWDGRRFSIARNKKVDDVVRAVMNEENPTNESRIDHQ